MTTFHLERELVLPQPIDRVFEFFGDPGNLEEITPSWLKFRVLRADSLPLREGSRIDYRLRFRGLPMRWTSLISRWDPPHVFVDEQLRGPYRRWVHTHLFEDLGEKTRSRDLVQYEVPGGRIVEALFVRRDLERIFEYRCRRLLELLGAADSVQSASSSA